MHNWSQFRLHLIVMLLMGLALGLGTPVAAQGPLPPRPAVEVPEADTLLLLLAGGSGGASYLWWRWRHR